MDKCGSCDETVGGVLMGQVQPAALHGDLVTEASLSKELAFQALRIHA